MKTNYTLYLILTIIFPLMSFAQIQFQEELGTPFDKVANSSIAFADVDGDNDQDVLITGLNMNSNPVSKLYFNNGNGVFSEATGTNFEGVHQSSIAFDDIDGDSDMDVLITGRNDGGQHSTKIYKNDGNGYFTELSGTPFDDVIWGSVAFVDIDSDNDVDVFITGYNNEPIAKLYTNNNGGSFTEVSGLPFDGVWFSSIAFSDIDGDADQDVLITGRNPSFQTITKLYLNNGIGGFTEVIGTSFDEVSTGSIAFADVDSDGDEDVLITGSRNNGLRIAKLYGNDGNGNFTELSGTPFDGVRYSSIAFADIDNDSDQDVLITGLNMASQNISKIYSNDSNGVFTEVSGTSFEGVSNSSVAFADIDGDADQDILITGRNSSMQNTSKLYLNNTVLSIEGHGLINKFFIYPNPVKGVLRIQAPISQPDTYIEIVNISGQCFWSNKIEFQDQNAEINLSFLDSGAYLINIVTKNRIFSKKLIKR